MTVFFPPLWHVQVACSRFTRISPASRADKILRGLQDQRIFWGSIGELRLSLANLQLPFLYSPMLATPPRYI